MYMLLLILVGVDDLTRSGAVWSKLTEMDQTRFTLIKVDMSITSFEKEPRIRERHRWLMMRCGKRCGITSVMILKRVISTASVWFI